MKIQEIISEARRNPRQNTGKPDRRELLQYLHSLPDEVRSRTMITSTSTDKIGINPRDQSYESSVLGHVTGVYCWTADQLISTNGGAAFAEILPYQFVIELKEQPTVITKELWNKLWDTVYQQVPDPHDDESDDEFDDETGRAKAPPSVKKAGAVANKVLRQWGITSIVVDEDKVISHHPGEAVILSLSAIKHYKRYVNHIEKDAEVDTMGKTYYKNDLRANRGMTNILNHVTQNNGELSIEQEKRLLNPYPLEPYNEFNFKMIRSYIDKFLIPNQKKFKIDKINHIIKSELANKIKHLQNELHRVKQPNSTQTMIHNDKTRTFPYSDIERNEQLNIMTAQIQELTPYLKYFSI
jgi:hypothetical protein